MWIDDLRCSATAIKDTPSPTQWTAIQPTGTFQVGAPVTIQGLADPNYYPLVVGSAKFFVDGAEVPKAQRHGLGTGDEHLLLRPTDATSQTGLHTFRAEVADTAGTVSAHEWSATAFKPPTAAWVTPVAGATIYNGHPAISMSLADNTPLATFTVTGQVHAGSAAGDVVATFEGSGLLQGINPFIFRLAGTGLPGDLAPGTYFLTATVTDSGGSRADRRRHCGTRLHDRLTGGHDGARELRRVSPHVPRGAPGPGDPGG